MAETNPLEKIPSELRQKILDVVYHPNYRPIKAKAIHQAIGGDSDEYPAVRMAIKRMVQVGELAYGGNHLVLTPEQYTGSDKTTRGTFRPAAAGFGFVRPVPTGRLGAVEDIFVPPSATGSAMEGDLVQVRLRSGRRGGQEGEIIEVIQRSRRQFAGSYQKEQGRAVVWLDGTNLKSPVAVGDVRGLPVEPGDKVVVEIARYPEGDFDGEGVIVEVLGSSKNPAVDTLAIMHQYGLRDEFPSEVIEQARKISDEFSEGQIAADENPSAENLSAENPARRDLTKVPTITIDPVDARDFDDAISLSKNDKGHWELMVHIADVSHFVPIGSSLDEEARERATSVYLPDRVLPMLPELISNHLASLQPGKVRLSKTVFMEFNSSGKLLHQEVFNSKIHNDCRLTYEQVDGFLDDRDAWKERLDAPVFELLGDMHTLAMTLRGNRNRDGALELHLPEIKIRLDKSGKVKGAGIVEHTESHQIIEEFMLAANTAVADWLTRLDVPFLRRVHAPPERRKMKKLNDFMRDLGIQCESLEDRFEIQRVVESVRGKPNEYAVNYAILKSMTKAVYQPEEEMHYALQFKDYCHFTSPIRRYPDLQVHRTVQRLIDGVKPAGDPLPVLTTLGQHCSDCEQNAEWAEREVIKVKLLHFLAKKVGEVMPGVISGVVPEGFYVRGTKFPAEGFVSIQSLPEDRYRFERRGQVIEGFRDGNRYRLGDAVTVKISSVDLVRRQLNFTLQSNQSARSTRPTAGRRGASFKAEKPKRGGKAIKKLNKKKTKRRRG
ncbi:MAG TPA: ribonuclease R [Planctomycetaceae bacterium]|nr:ribonuclease R [Planctomycetaceae bacterium]